MAIRSGFFNSVNGDRKYNAGSFAEYFASFISSGVFPNPSTNLQVMANNDMTVTVRAGKAWINGYILINDDDYILEIEPADGVLNRIDRIVARYDVANREITLEVKQGTFASSPVAPTLQRDADAYELGLADIQVNAGVISISQSAITDLRLNNELCGIVHGTVEQVDTTTLFNQYVDWYTTTTGQAKTDIEAIKQQFQQDFMVWFDSVKDILDENTAGNLLNIINDHKAEKATQDGYGHIRLQDIPVKSVNSKTGEVAIDVGDIAGLVGSRLALGRDASAAGNYAAALGEGASAGNYAVALGRDASAGDSAVALGDYASAENYAVALGLDASAGNDAVALGWTASAEGNSAVALGEGASAGNSAVALGTYASAAGGKSSVALGNNSSAGGEFAVALGWTASAGIAAVALGTYASAAGDYAVALGNHASAENANEGILGGTVSYTTSKWKVPGSFTVSGTKNFEIPHPKPEKKATHVIRHGAVESPTPGDTLYRWKIQATKDNDLVTIDLPDYFVWLNKDVQIFVTPQGHFGNGFGELNRETEQLEIHCQFKGEYNVLVIGTRNDDHQSVQDWDIKGVEREIGESWTGETYAFSVDEFMEVEEIKEVV